MSGEIEKVFRQGVHAIRWLLAPMYLGLALLLIVVLVQFVRDFFRALPELFQITAVETLPSLLSLALVLLAANAVLTILQTGYQLFAPGLNSDTEPEASRGRIDFSKLARNFLAMSVAVSLLLVFRELLIIANQGAEPQTQHLWSLASILGVFVGTALVLAVAEWFSRLARK